MEKLVHIDYKLKFDTHIEILCKNMGKKLHVPARVIKYMATNHTQILDLIISLLSGWSCMNVLWELFITIKTALFRTPWKGKSVTIHERNIEVN